MYSSRLPSSPHFFKSLLSEHQGHSQGINPAVIMLVRVTAYVACVETPVLLWRQGSASGVLPAFTYTDAKNRAVSRSKGMAAQPGLLPSHQSACLIRMANSPCSTITAAVIFSLLLELEFNCAVSRQRAAGSEG